MLPFQGRSFIFRRGGIGGNHQENPRVDPGSGFQSWQPSKVHGFKRTNHPNISFGTDKMGVGTKHLRRLYGYALKIADNKIQVPP